MKQCEIYMANLDPIHGSEQSGFRPVVIISGDGMNNNFPVRIVCPFTTSQKMKAACVSIKQTKTNGLSANSQIIPFQVRTVSISRLQKKIGSITIGQLHKTLHYLLDICTY